MDTLGRGWLAPSSFDPDHIYETGICMDSLSHFAAEIGAMYQCYLLDCCKAGAVINPQATVELNQKWLGADENGDDSPASPQIYALAAAKRDEAAKERCGRGSFTEQLVETMRRELSAGGCTEITAKKLGVKLEEDFEESDVSCWLIMFSLKSDHVPFKIPKKNHSFVVLPQAKGFSGLLRDQHPRSGPMLTKHFGVDCEGDFKFAGRLRAT
jgi:hypothetical protein